MEEKKFIVAYAPDFMSIEADYMEKTMVVSENSMAWNYRYALSRHGYSAEDNPVIPYNNQFWCSVKAVNAAEAFRKAMDKFHAYWDTARSAT